MTRKYPAADVKMLYGRAAARCAFPRCRIDLVLDGTAHDKTKQIGKIAHIIAHGNSGPRADTGYPAEKRDTYGNWILLCPTCHDTVDAQENTYTTQYLRDLKRDHEQWVRESLESVIASVGFAELEVAVKGIAQKEGPVVTGFSVIAPDDKIRKNELTVTTRNLLVMGLMRGAEVGNYLREMDKIDAGFADRLTSGFKAQYAELRAGGLVGDALFEELLTFASGGSEDFKIKAAGLALLSHLFELCEVFEK